MGVGKFDLLMLCSHDMFMSISVYIYFARSFTWDVG